MPDIFPFPNETQVTGIYEFTEYANIVTDGIFIPLFVWMIFIVTFIASKNFETSKAFTLASFISMMIAIPFSVLNLVSPRFMYLYILMLGTGLVWIKLQSGRIG